MMKESTITIRARLDALRMMRMCADREKMPATEFDAITEQIDACRMELMRREMAANIETNTENCRHDWMPSPNWVVKVCLKCSCVLARSQADFDGLCREYRERGYTTKFELIGWLRNRAK